MAFPSTPLDIRTELQLNGVWVDVSADVYVRDPKDINHGRRDMGARTDPGHLTLTFNNRDGKYSPDNPMSPLWEQIGQNTPIRVSVPGATPYVELSGDPGTFVSTPDHASLDLTGDLDIRVEADINWHSPTLNQVLIAKWDAPGQRSYSLRVFDQLLNFNWTTDGATNQFAAWTLPALPPHAAVRATLDVNNGAGLYVVRLYWAPSIAGPWTQFGPDRTGPATSVFSGTAALRVGGADATTVPPRHPFAGKGYKFEVRNGINGTLVASPDFTAQPPGTAAFADSAGRTWSYSGTAHASDRAFRIVGEVSEWPKEWQSDGSDVWSSVEASGVLRRYEQGTKALHSTLRRRIPSANPIAYWPMEEDTQASRAYSPIVGVQAAALTGVEWASVDTLPSSKPLPRLTAAATLSAIVPTATAGQWQVEFVYNADDKAPPAAGGYAELLSVSSTGTVRRWTIGMRADRVRIYGFDAAGNDLAFTVMLVGGEDIFHGWYRMRLYVQDLGGGQMEWVIGFANVNGTTSQVSKTITATAGRVQALTATWGALTEGWSIGHLSVMPTAANVIYDGSDSAYSGETAWDRMRRLAEEESIPLARIPGELATERVGPQLPEKLVDLLAAAAAADGGMLLEDRDRLGLIYRDRSSLYTQQPALILDATAPGLASDDLRPAARSDSRRNDITVKRTGGSEARAVLEEGRLSVQVPPNGIGLYDESLELSLDDDTQMEPLAYWRLHLRTYEGAVYPAVSVMLHKPGAQVLIPSILALREGDLIRITNLPNFVEFGDLDLIVEGVKEKLDLHEWRVTFNCSPGTPWNTAVADHPTFAKTDTAGSALAAPLDATSTAVPVRATAGLLWTTDPAEMPIDIKAGGEVMRVTAIGERILHANPRFDVDLSGWTGSGAALVRTTTPNRVPPGGIASMQIAPNGVAVSGGANSAVSAVGSVTPGRSYTAAGLAFTAGGWSDLRVCVDWQDAAGAFLSSSLGVGTAVAANVWTPLSQTFVAPVGATRATIRARHGGTPPVSATWYVWDLRLIAVGDQTMTASRSVNGVTKSHAAGAPVQLAHPAPAPL